MSESKRQERMYLNQNHFENKKASQHKCLAVLLMVCVAAVMGTFIFLNIFRYTAQMDSDIGAEALNARAIWEHQSIVPEEFYPSTETRILNVNLLGALFYGLTGNMNLSMGIACSVMMILLAALYAKLLRKLSFGQIPTAAGVLLLLVIPGSMRHAQILFLYAVYYAIHCILMLVTLMVWLNVIHAAKGWRWQAAVAIALAAVISLSGLRAALICYAPLTALELVRTALFFVGKGRSFRTDRACTAMNPDAAAQSKKSVRDEERIGDNAHRRGLAYAVSLLLASLLGACAPTAVGVGTTRNIRGGISKLLTTVLPDVWNCLYCENQSILRTILLILLLGIMGVVAGWYAACAVIRPGGHQTSRDNNLKSESAGDGMNHACILSFFWMSFLVDMAMGAFTTTDSVWRYYFMIYFVMSFSAAELLQRLSAVGERLSAVDVKGTGIRGIVSEKSVSCTESDDGIDGNDGHETRGGFRLCGVLRGTLVCTILIFTVLVWRQDFLPSLLHPAANEEYDTIIAWMEEHDCQYGYSTYDSSNAMTAYCNGAVQVSAVADLGTLEICKWLTDRTWYVPYLTEDMETAYIIPKSRMEEFECQLAEHSDIALQLETENYYVYAAPHNYTSAEQ